MKKKTILIIICFMLIIIAVGTACTNNDEPEPKSGTLYVNGKEITGEHVKIYSNYAELPFVEVMKALGHPVEWIDDSTAIITCNGIGYTLDLSDETRPTFGYNEFLVAPGSTTYTCKVLDRELILDGVTLKTVLRRFYDQIIVKFDRVQSKVYVNVTLD